MFLETAVSCLPACLFVSEKQGTYQQCIQHLQRCPVCNCAHGCNRAMMLCMLLLHSIAQPFAALSNTCERLYALHHLVPDSMLLLWLCSG